MIAKLIDPCGTLGVVRKKLIVDVTVILFFSCLMVASSFVFLSRFAGPLMIVLYQPVMLCNSLGLVSIRKLAAPKRDWSARPVRFLIVAASTLLLLTWFDVVFNKAPDHLIESNLRIAQIPALREMVGLLVVLGVCFTSILIAFARRASEAIALGSRSLA